MNGKINVEDVLASVDIVDLIGQHVDLKKKGQSHVGLCPFHGEKTPSFHVHAHRQLYHCFGCGAKGDAISFVRDYFRLNFQAACEQLAGKQIRVSTEEIEAAKARRAVIERQAAEEQARVYAEKAGKAAEIWEACTYSTPDHPYLIRKQIKPFGLKRSRDQLIVPVYDMDGKLMSLQFIQPDGGKKFLTGGKTGGGFCLIGEPDDTLLVCEGYATGASLFMATRSAVAVAMSSGNMPAVAHALRSRYPAMNMIICADIGEAGITKGLEAAKQCGGTLVYPTFAELDFLDGKKPTDFNDLHCMQGLEAVARVVLAGVSTPPSPPLAVDQDETPPSPPLAGGGDEPPPWLLDGDQDEPPPNPHLAVDQDETPPSPPLAGEGYIPLPEGDQDGGIGGGEPSPKPKGKKNGNEPWKKNLVWGPVKDDEPPKLVKCVNNIMLILENDPRWNGVLTYDAFRYDIVCATDAPDSIAKKGTSWDKPHNTRVTAWFERKIFKSSVQSNQIVDAVEAVAMDHQIHEVVEWLDGLPAWDGVDRLSTFCRDAYGVDQSEYAASIGRYLFSALVKRVTEPGCKADMMVILEGLQGAGKSTSIELLMENKDWFAVVMHSPNNNDFYQCLKAKWLLEVAELDSFSRAENAATKRAVSTNSDYYRASYGYKAQQHPRQCIFVGTTNHTDWNKDETGARRYLPIYCTKVDIEYIKTHRRQLFAQAKHEVVVDPNRWWASIPIDDAKAEQDKRYNPDAWEELIEEHLSINNNETFTLQQIMQNALNLDVSKQGKSEQTRVGNALRHLGYVPKQVMEGGRRLRKYMKTI